MLNQTIRTIALILLFTGVGLLSNGQAAVKGAKPPASSGSGKVLESKGQANAPKGTPTWEIQDIERKLEDFNTSDKLTPAQRAKNRQIKRQILGGTFDLRELSRLALDKHWDQIAAGEQSNFVNLMTDLLETKAIFSKEQSRTKGKSYTVLYQGDQYYSNKKRAKTLTQIYVPKENITLDIEYRLRQAGGGWKVFDIIVDGASLVENYRYQFNTIITKHGYPELVNRMRKKLAELKSSQS